MDFEEILAKLPKPYYRDEAVAIYHADCRELSLSGISAVVTDPPYELGFMGKSWDSKGVSFQKETWEKIRSYCLSGAPLLSFGGSRTQHRIACAIEDAGWEIRDTLMWCYGSGFPKSLDISKAIDKAKGTYVKGDVLPSSRTTGASTTGIATTFREKTAANPQSPEAQLWEGYGTALKPAYEPILVCMNPLDGAFANNALKHGVAGLNIAGSRVGYQSDYDMSQATPQGRCTSKEISAIGAEPDAGRGLERVGFERPERKGRFPANFLHDGSKEVLELFPNSKTNRVEKPCPAPEIKGHKWGTLQGNRPARGYEENGSAARFFYCAKASRSERNLGLDGLPEKSISINEPRNSKSLEERYQMKAKNNHPTVKPLALMKYLCKLVKMPEYNLILDPFCGSGTTLIACGNLGIRSIGIEIEERYCEIAAKRLSQSVMKYELETDW